MICLLTSLAFSHPINDNIRSFNSHSKFDIPVLTDKQIDDLNSHKVVKILDSGDGMSKPKRGIGLLLTQATPNDLWIAYSDDHFTLNPNFHYIQLEVKAQGNETWYGLVDLPWPFEDRHWVTTSWNNLEMASLTDNQMWEHPWVKSPEFHEKARKVIASGVYPKLKAKNFDEAIFLPENSGALATIKIGKSTLLIYHATGTIGGIIPDDLMLRYLLHSLTDLLNGIEERALQNVKAHYTTGHKPVISGSGVLIPYY